MAASGAKVLALRSVEYARRYGVPVHVRSSFTGHEGPWSPTLQSPSSTPRPNEGEAVMEAPIISGVAHDRSEAKITVVGVPDVPGMAAAHLRGRRRRRREHRHDRAERLGRRDRAAPTSRSPCPRRTARRDHGAHRASARGHRLRVAAARRPDRQALARRRRHEVAPRRLGAAVRRAARRRHQHRDDLHLGDPHLGRHPRGHARRRRARRAHRVRPRQPTDEAVVYGGTGR